MDIVTLGELGTQDHMSIEEAFLVWVFTVVITIITIIMMTNALNLDLKNRVVHFQKIFLLPATIHQVHQLALKVFPKISPAAQVDRPVAPALVDRLVAPALVDHPVAPVHRKIFQGVYQVVRPEAREAVKVFRKASQAKAQINAENYFSIIC